VVVRAQQQQTRRSLFGLIATGAFWWGGQREWASPALGRARGDWTG
jgi:hypothetical protein